MKILLKGTFTVTLTWTNWTFGIWWTRFPAYRKADTKSLRFGIEIGPLKLAWEEES